jgi:hypothetical protein
MAVTAAMHLLFLVAFSWMLVEGLLLWDRVVTVSMRPGPRMRLYHAAGWGEALLPALALFSTVPYTASTAMQQRPTPVLPSPVSTWLLEPLSTQYHSVLIFTQHQLAPVTQQHLVLIFT